MPVTVEPKASNILKLLSLMSPVLLVFFMVMLSLFNQDIKGIVYLGGVLIAAMVNVMVAAQIGTEPDPAASVVCSVFSLPGMPAHTSPCASSLIVAFTIAYLILPMFFNKTMNYAVIVALLCLFGLDARTKVASLCTPTAGVVLFHASGLDSLLYFNTYSSNKVFCEKPAKQTFKCRVYKNGQLVSSNVA